MSTIWKKVANTEFYISHYEDNGYNLFLTDYLTIWYAFFSKSLFIKCLKESNKKYTKILESVMLQHSSAILTRPDEVKKIDTKIENKTLTLTLIKQFAYDFTVSIKFTEGSKELYFQKITQPLMQSVVELRKSQGELCNLLTDKDNEIEAHKRHDSIKAHERTKKFDANAHQEKFKEYRNIFDPSKSFSLLDKRITVPEDAMIIQNQRESEDVKPVIKLEPGSQTDTNIVSNLSETDNHTEYKIKKDLKAEVKLEPVKTEPQMHSPRKKFRKINLI